MDIQEIETLLDSPNPQSRMKAIAELRHHQPAIAVPLLKRRMHDKELLVRSFVAMGLGNKRTDEAFDLLLDILEYETDDNIIAEAANSLAKYGDRAVPHLVKIFEGNAHWLIRQSILAAVEGVDYPDVLIKLCRLAFEENDLMVKQSALAYLEQFQGTPQASDALGILLQAAAFPSAEIRAQVARSLRHFKDPKAESALLKLQHDPDHRVVGAALERLL